jgi:hypothetical protein
MSSSFKVMHAGLSQHAIRTQFIARAIVPGKPPGSTLQISAFSARAEPVDVTRVSYRGTRRGAKMFPVDSNSTSRQHDPERFMTITAAHIQPIVALIAGVLILIMPRFLNFVVAIYLIFIGLAGLGLFKMFKI